MGLANKSLLGLRYSLVPPVMVLVLRGFKYYIVEFSFYVFDSTKYKVSYLVNFQICYGSNGKKMPWSLTAWLSS